MDCLLVAWHQISIWCGITSLSSIFPHLFSWPPTRGLIDIRTPLCVQTELIETSTRRSREGQQWLISVRPGRSMGSVTKRMFSPNKEYDESGRLRRLRRIVVTWERFSNKCTSLLIHLFVDARAATFKNSLLSVDVDVCMWVCPHLWG